MTQVDLIIFDLDGTLIDSRLDIADCVNLTLDELGLDSIPNEDIYEYVGHGVRALMKGAVDEAHGNETLDQYAKALKIFDKYYRNKLLDNTQLFPGMRDVLDHLQDKSLAVITNKPQKYTDPIIEGLGLKNYFRAVLGREACAHPKPHPDPIYKVIENVPAAKERTVIIGDTEIDIETGKNAEVLTCGVLFGFGREEKIREAAPDFIVKEVRELLEIFA